MGKCKYPQIQIGQTFGKLTVVSYDGIHNDGKHYWLCSCSCDGNIKSYKKENLNNGNSTTCGCGRFDHTINNNIDYTNKTNSCGSKLIRFYKKNEKKQCIWECECGICGNHFYAIPSALLNNHPKTCGCIKRENFNSQNRTINNSFEDWCIKTNHLDYLDMWDYDLNHKSPSETGMASSLPVYFKCKNDICHNSFKVNLSHVTTRGNKISCPTCNSFGAWIDNIYGEGYLNKIWNKKKNIGIDPYSISKSSNIKVHLRCLEKEYHGYYYVSINKYYSGYRCYYCNKNSGKIHPKDSLAALYPEVKMRWSKKNSKPPYQTAVNGNKKMWLTCPCGKHDDYEQLSSNAIRCEFRCIKCTEEDVVSSYQNKVSNYLSNHYPNYTVLHEQNCTIKIKNPKSNYPLRFDNEIKEIKLLIEVHGEHRYKENGFNNLKAKSKNTNSKDELNYIIKKDEYKKHMALSLGYNYISIPYWEFENNNYQTIIDDEIKRLTNS